MLLASQVEHYRTQGFVTPITALTEDEAATYRDTCNALETALGGKPRTVQVRQMHLHMRWAYELATHPRILDAVQSLLGENLIVWATELFAKHPHDANIAIGWHRDAPYIGLESGEHVTAWIALADSTPANGCMRVLPRTAEQPNHHTDAPNPEEEPNLVDVTLRAGELSFHAGDVIHGSGPNLSSHKRVGFVVRYVSSHSRPRAKKPPVLHVRGSAPCDAWSVVAPPTETDPAVALARTKHAATEHFDRVLGNLKRAKEPNS